MYDQVGGSRQLVPQATRKPGFPNRSSTPRAGLKTTFLEVQTARSRSAFNLNSQPTVHRLRLSRDSPSRFLRTPKSQEPRMNDPGGGSLSEAPRPTRNAPCRSWETGYCDKKTCDFKADNETVKAIFGSTSRNHPRRMPQGGNPRAI